MTPVFLMSPPRNDWGVQGQANFRSREASEVDPSRARVEWTSLADAIVDAGGEVLVCPPNPRRRLTGMIYTAEAGDMYLAAGEPRFVLPNLTPEHRRLEADWIGGFFEGLGIATEAIEARWEGQGDAIRALHPDRIVHTYGEGSEARSEEGAYGEIADRLSDEHVAIRFEADPWFHGNTFMNVYRAPEPVGETPGVLLICPDAVEEPAYRSLREFLPDVEVAEISREASLGYDTNSLQVGETILAPANLSETAARAFRRLGLKVVNIELGELFGKGGGAPVCLTNRLWHLRPGDLPEHALWSERPHLGEHTVSE